MRAIIEAFKIGVTIALVNRASAALGMIGRDLRRTDVDAKALQRSLKDISLLTIGGGALAGAGMAGLKLIDGWYGAAKQYEQAYARFRSLNLGDVISKDADKFAQSTRVMGVSATDLMTTVTDLHTVLGNYEHAKNLAPLISKMEFANKAVFDAGSKFDQQQALNMARVIEMRGGFKSEAAMKLQADYMQHVLTGTGGRVTPTDFLSFIKTAGVAGRLQGNDVFYYQMEPLIQELGGLRTGTGLMSAYQNIGQGRTSARTVKELMRLGLIDRSMAEFDKVGQLVRVKPGGIKGGDMVASDPMGFLNSVLLPAFAKKGITGEKAIINEIGTIFTNRTAASLFSLIYLQQEKIQKNMAINRNALGVEGLINEAGNTPAGQEEKVAKAYENLRIQLGLKVIPVVLPLLEKLANGLQTLAGVAERNPALTKFLTLGFAGLSVLGVVLGGVALVAAGIIGAGILTGGAIGAGTALAIAGIATGIVALGAAVVAWWPDLKRFFAWLHPFSSEAGKSGPTHGPRGGLIPGAGVPSNATAVPPGAALAPPPADVHAMAEAMKASMNNVGVYMDGHLVGNLVTKQQGQALSAPPTGPSYFDPRLSPSYPGSTY